MIDSPHRDRPVLLGFLVDQLDTSPKTAEISCDKLATYFLLNHEESPCSPPPSEGAPPLPGAISCVASSTFMLLSARVWILTIED